MFEENENLVTDVTENVEQTTEEFVDGVLFSLLVMIDGDSGMNDFHPLRVVDDTDGEQIDCGYLHEYYYRQENK